MLSRREVLMMAPLSVAALRQSTRRPAKAPQPSTAVAFDVPAGACDCHTHVFGDRDRFPFTPNRTYTPESASVEEMRALHHALHTTRVVIVQPSVYGTDNACTLDGIKQLGPNARGIAVIDEQTPDAKLDDLEHGGIRGIRINLATAGQTDPELGRRRFETAVTRIGKRKWHVQMYTQLSVIEAMQKELAASPVPVVFDHFGGAQASAGRSQRGFDVLLDLVRSGRAYVKVSAPYRGSTAAPDFADMGPLAKALIAANVRRILWGTDWPHPDTTPGRAPTEISPLRQIDDGRVFNQFGSWTTATERRSILVDNPQELYGF
ncbi:MAG TPA: amidohydrolase family protein [Vicinamibacterales bacterium]|nr:amidohydrolase family protein [Vicinamibacterales bacterium]